MSLVQTDGLLDGLVADDVAVGQVLCNDSRAWLVFLLKMVAGFVSGSVSSGSLFTS